MNLEQVVKQIGLLHSAGSETPTSFTLTKDVGNQLDCDWSDPTMKFVDPACGRGNFLLAVYSRLRAAGHKPKHIVDNMLYGCDIKSVQALITIKALQLVSGIKSKNIYCDDSLTRNWNMEFDVFITNPPFQKPDKAGRDDDNLWPKFIDLASQITKPGGEIALVTPASWASLGSNPKVPGSKIRKQHFDTKQVKFVDFTAGKHFTVGSTFSAYIITNSAHDPKLKTKFVFEDTATEDLFANYPCVSLKHSNSEYAKIINRFRSQTPYSIVSDDPFPQQRASMKKKIVAGEYATEPSSTHTYRAYHTNSQTHLYSKYKSKIHSKWKAVFSYSGTWQVEVSNDCSLTDASLAVVCDTKKQAESVKSVLSSTPVSFLIDQVYRWSGYYSGSFMAMIPQLPMDKIYTDDEVYDLLFTKKQAKLIKTAVAQLSDKIQARLKDTPNA